MSGFGRYGARLTAVQMHYCDSFCVVCLVLRLLDLVQEWMQLVIDCLDLVSPVLRSWLENPDKCVR